MNIKKILIIIIISLILLGTGCLKTNGDKANALIKEANSCIKEYVLIEQSQIEPLREKINKTDGTVKGAKASLKNIKIILLKVDEQQRFLKKAKQSINEILELPTDENLETYSKLTVEALDADLENIRISRKLYKELRKMYEFISEENMSQKDFELISNNIDSLTLEAQEASDKQAKLHEKKDSYYQKHNLDK